MLSPPQYMRSSSSQLAKSISSMTINQSLKKNLNKLGSNIDPCGTPKRIASQELYELFALVLQMVR